MSEQQIDAAVVAIEEGLAAHVQAAFHALTALDRTPEQAERELVAEVGIAIAEAKAEAKARG